MLGAHILPVLREATAPAVEALAEKLSHTTIADIAGGVLARREGAARMQTSPERADAE
jgi:hypothetical protein